MNHLIYYPFGAQYGNGTALAPTPNSPMLFGTGGAGPTSVFTIQMTTMQGALDKGNS